jgi:hypothetical protein
MVELRRRSALYLLTGPINILIGLTGAYASHDRNWSRSYYSSGYTTYHSAADNRWSCWASLSRFVAWILTPVFWVLDHPLAAGRFASRYTCKALAAKRKDRKDRHHSKPLRHQNRGPGKGPAESGPDASETHTMPVLPYQLLLKVSRDLHFVDLINASRSSKRLRTTLFGRDGPNTMRLDDLRRFTCQGHTKRSCDLCGIQTCPVSASSEANYYPA